MSKLFFSTEIQSLFLSAILISFSLPTQGAASFPIDTTQKATFLEKVKLIDHHPNIVKSKKRNKNKQRAKKINNDELDNKYGLFALACMIGSFVILFTSIIFGSMTTISGIVTVGAYVFLVVFATGGILAFLGTKRDTNIALAKRIWRRFKRYGFMALIVLLFL